VARKPVAGDDEEADEDNTEGKQLEFQTDEEKEDEEKEDAGQAGTKQTRKRNKSTHGAQQNKKQVHETFAVPAASAAASSDADDDLNICT
jgi:hypothetical protein